MRHLAVLASYLLLSAAWSWPTCRFADGVLVTRQFDLYPAIWLVDRASDGFPSLYTAWSAWPVGEALTRADSFVLLFLGWLVHGAIPATTVCALLTWIGPAVSAFAAERCAGDGFGVARPWSWFAGVAYGFSGIAATACLEGHVYQLLDPWLPMLWWAWERGTGRWGGRLVGLAFAGALLTSAYHGVLALLLLVVLALGEPRRAWALAWGVATVAVPVGAGYAWLFAQGGGFGDGQALDPARVLVDGTVAAAGLAGWSPATDLAGHSIGAPVGWMGFWLLLLAPVALRREPGWAGPFVLALAALGIALGRAPAWALAAPAAGPFLDRFAALPGLGFLRFPARATWVYALVAGVVGARVLGAAAARHPRFATGALLLGVADAVVGTGLPWRLGTAPAGVPSAYAAVAPERAVLDLFGRPADRSGGDLELWARALGCYYQTVHERPILEVCLGTSVDSPREIADRWLTRQLLGGAVDPRLVGDLGALGVGGVAVHADFYRPGDYAALADALRGVFGDPAATSTDGGERVVVFRVPAGSSGDVSAAWERVRAGGR